MTGKKISYPLLIGIATLLFYSSCKESASSHEPVIARSPEEFQQKSTDLIKEYLDEIEKNNEKLDSTILNMPGVVRTIYNNNSFKPAWSENEQWHPQADSLFELIQHAKWYGLFPEDYHFSEINTIRNQFFNDSLLKNDRRDVGLWTKADIMLTDAFVHIIKDVKLGRLPQDSVTLRTDSVLDNDFYWQQFYVLQKRGSLENIIERHEPKHIGYRKLKEGIRKFLENTNDKEYTKVPPVKDPQFKMLLQRRLYEAGYLETDSIKADSLQLAVAIKNFQNNAGINADGKVGDITLRMMNVSPKEQFVRIAITMDRYKLLPEKMPDRYLMVNLPGYNLKLMEGDSVALYSKIICGKPLTRSPLLNSSISELITYPQWTVPQSIIEKEILPGAKKNSSYITKKGFSLLDSKGNVIDPDSVNWSKFKRSIPYKVVQGSGDANALGIMKFNFNNKYAVYLHDTNQRYLFANSDRALSHGCIRVQNWESLAFDILRHEEQEAKEDSVKIWLKEKKKHSVSIRNRLPLFIRYFTCEGKDGNIVFYDDIYGEDKMLHKKYFSGK